MGCAASSPAIVVSQNLVAPPEVVQKSAAPSPLQVVVAPLEAPAPAPPPSQVVVAPLRLHINSPRAGDDDGREADAQALPPSSGAGASAGVLTLLHFNDVYEISSSKAEPAGGAARFSTAVRRARARAGPSLLLFSGDAVSPSLLSTVVRGRQMVDALNAVGVDGACVGNHDLDFGVPTFEELCGVGAGASSSAAGAASAKSFAFPWLLSNVKVAATGRPLGEARETLVLEPRGAAGGPFERVGLFGVWEREVIATLATVEPSLLAFEPPVDAARRACAQLRAAGCGLVIALTHMRVPNDLLLARARVPGLDLILGGHDHDYSTNASELAAGGAAAAADEVPIVKSGTDFRYLSEIRISLARLPARAVPSCAGAPEELMGAFESSAAAQPSYAPARRLFVEVVKHSVLSSVPEDPVVAAIVDGYNRVLDSKMESVIGMSKVALDSRFAVVRSQECAVGNLVADLMRHITGADMALLNSGTLRADAVLGPGILKMRDLVRLLPLQDSVATVRLSGRLVLAVLENGLFAYPKLEGRFLQVSGVRFKFDAEKPPGSRIVPGSVLVLSNAAGKGNAARRSVNASDDDAPPAAGAASLAVVSNAEEAQSDSESDEDGADREASRRRRAAAQTKAASGSQFAALDLDARYTCAIKGYLLKGKDGFDAFRDPSVEVLVDEELGPVLPVAMRNYFRLLSSLSSFQRSEKETKMVRQVTLPRLNRVRKVRVSTDHVAAAAALAAAGVPSDASAGGAAHDGFQIGGGSYEDEEASGVSPASPMSPMSPARRGITGSSEEGDAALLGATPFAHSVPASPTSFASPSGLALDGALTPASRMQSSSQIDDVAKRAWTEQKRKLRGGAKATAFALAVNPKTDGRIEKV